MTIQKVLPGGKTRAVVDRLGGLFTPVPGARQRPVYTYGPGKVKDVLFQCPASAIPDEVWQLLVLWWACRQTRTMPMAGGFVDQPRIVQIVFPILESQMQATDQGKADPAERAAALAVGSMVQLMRAGKS